MRLREGDGSDREGDMNTMNVNVGSGSGSGSRLRGYALLRLVHPVGDSAEPLSIAVRIASSSKDAKKKDQ